LLPIFAAFALVLVTATATLATMTIPQANAYVLKWYVGPATSIIDGIYDSVFLPNYPLQAQEAQLAKAQALLNSVGDHSEDADILLAHNQIERSRAGLFQAKEGADDAHNVLITRIQPRVEAACGCTYP